MSGSSLAPEIIPAETYQIDSDDYDSDQERDDLEDDEYDRLVEEGMLCRSLIAANVLWLMASGSIEVEC